jgi:hypothetical protein
MRPEDLDSVTHSNEGSLSLGKCFAGLAQAAHLQSKGWPAAKDPWPGTGPQASERPGMSRW